ncbi:MAG: winged helix-turn-helix domain-containing protein [Pseudomonadota bacterium]
MSADSNQRTPFKLGTANVDPGRNTLERDGQEWRLEPKVMDVLCLLAERQGDVVSRAHLIERLWVSEFGADEALTRAVSRLRSALREIHPDTPTIETVPKRGYRLLLPVSSTSSNVVAAASEHYVAGAPTHMTPRPWLWRGLLLMVVALAGVLVLVLQSAQDTPTPVEPTVAVLPFEPLSNNESDRYFAQGIAEELLNALDQFPDLKVIARTSAFIDDPGTSDTRARARKLRANHVVTGSVRRYQDRIRISVALLQVEDMASLWADTYEFDAKDLFAIEDTIVRELANALQVRLGVGAAVGRSDGGGINQAAYDQYLQGLQLWGDRMRKDDTRQRALAAFQRAVAFDPQFADAWAAIGTVGVYSAGSPLSRDRMTFMRMTEEALQTAIALDPENARANAALAVFHVTQRIDIDKARYHLGEAQSAAPQSAFTHYASAWFHRTIGDTESAFAALDRTRVLDPLNPVRSNARAAWLVETGRFDEAMAVFEACFQARCLGEGFIAFAGAAAAFSDSDEYRQRWLPRVSEFEARVAAIPADKLPNVAILMPAFTSIEYGRADVDEQIERVRSLFSERLITDSIGIWGPAFARVLPAETTLDILHLAYERGDLFSTTFSQAPFDGVNPWPRDVRAHPRYHALWQRPGMPELAAAWRQYGRTAGLPTNGDQADGPSQSGLPR